MKTKNLIILSLFVGIGAILHAIIPGFVSSMQPDFSLIMMFLGILLFPDKKSVILLGVATGIVSGLTSSIGLIPNLIDKVITSLCFFGLYLIARKTRNIIINACLSAVGTLISGTVFLSVALVLIGLPESFIIMFTGAVLPATLVNSIAILLIYPIVLNIAKRAKIIEFA